MKQPATLLCTRQVDETVIQYCSDHQVALHAFNFIETENIVDVETQQEIEFAIQLQTTVIFTSTNAVKAVADFLEDERMPQWKIYCIGHATRNLIEHYFGADVIEGIADDAAALGQKILDDNVAGPVIFFCGTKRREALPEILDNGQINLQEIFVYHTIEVHRNIKMNYSGIIFFSPSAVQSFFATNKVTASTVFFAIGATTADQITAFSTNAVITADKMGKQNLIEQAVEYFSAQ